MSRRKKKNAVTLILLLLALAGLIGFYVRYTNREPVTEEETEQEMLSLVTTDTEKVSTLHYIYEDTDLTLIKEEGIWRSETDRSRPMNQDRVKSILSVIDEISATRIIAESTESLKDYGLDAPTSYLKATLEDGTTVTLRIGDEAATGNGYYALVNEDNKIYLVADTYGSGLNFTNDDMTAVASDLTIEAANIRHISVDNRDREDFELRYDENNGLDHSGSNMFPWVILKPYTQGYAADTSTVATLQQKYTTFDYIRCVDYNPVDLNIYGLENPMTTISLEYLEVRTENLDTPEKNPETGEEITEKTYYDPKEYQIFAGNLDENNNYYVLIEGDRAVYTIDKDAIDNMIEVDAFNLLNKFIAIPKIDMVDKIDIDTFGTQYIMNMERTTVKNASDDDEVETRYYYNGELVEEDIFKDVYQIMIAAKYDAQSEVEIDTEGMEPHLTMAFYLNDEKKTILTTSFLPYDESFYLISNGEARFLADRRKIDEIITAIMEFKATEE